MSKERLTILTALVTIGSMVLAACGPTPEPSVVQETRVVIETIVEEVTTVVEVVVTATPEPEPTELPVVELEGLWYRLRREPPSLDIQGVADASSLLIIKQCIEGLFEYRGDGSIEPTGATGFEVSDEGLVYTINLRPEAVWSDGVPVTAQHFVDGVIRLLDPDTEAYYAWLMYDVEGAEAFNSGESDDPATVGVRAVDETTLEVRLGAPASYFETVLPFQTFYPVRLDIIEEHGERWTEPGNYLSNGPYLLDAWEHGAEVVLVKNPTYWNADNVPIEKVTLPVILDEDTLLAKYENDELHCTGESDYLAEHVPQILADPVLSQELRVLPRPGVYYIGLNTLHPPTDDVLVRKALASAIDRQSFIENVIEMPWRTPMSCTTPPMILGHQVYGTCGYTFDPGQARAFLAEAGHPDGEDLPVLNAWAVRGREAVLEAIAAMWEENLSIPVELRILEWDMYLDYLDDCNSSKEELAACEFNAYLLGWVMDYGDPQNQLELLFAPGSVWQRTGWESERYRELMALAGSEFDTAMREEYYKEADKILCEDEVAIIPITGFERGILVKEGVTFEFPPFVPPAFKHWDVP